MRRLLVALIVVTVALALAGCGGGGDEAAAPAEGDAAAEAPATPAGGGNQEEEVVDNSPPVEGYPMAFPEEAQVVPQDVLDRLEAGQPLFIYYFDEDRTVVDELDNSIDAVMADYRGLIHLVEYGISGDIEDVVENEESLGEGLPEEERTELKKVYRLADELKVFTTPFIILVDREGTIVWMHRGYVDGDTLELQVLYATQ